MKKTYKIILTILFVLTHLRSIFLAFYYSRKSYQLSMYMVNHFIHNGGYNPNLKKVEEKYKKKEEYYLSKLEYLNKLWENKDEKV